MNLKDRINFQKLPRHVAIIMDGNGRWAKSKNKERFYGHQEGVESVRVITESAAELGVDYLTLYAFSKENWNRPQEEVDALMELLVLSLEREVGTFNKNNIKLEAIGDVDNLPEKSRLTLQRVISDTSNNSKMTLVLALNYSSRWEILNAAKNMAIDLKKDVLSEEDFKENNFNKYLTTNNIPDPELLIRTSGEYRISNFLLWQLAYTELYFSKKYWPDFRQDDFYKAIIDFQGRERRFGKTSEQLKGK